MDHDGDTATAPAWDRDLQPQLADAFDATVTPGQGGAAVAAASEADHITALAADLRGATVTGTADVPASVSPPAAVTEYLPGLLASMTASPLSTLLHPLASQLDWYQIFDHGYAPDTLSNGMMAGQVIGGRGLLRSSAYYFGLFLVAPHITYPLHQHAALEIYCVLSGEIFIRHGREKPAMHITAGGHSVTPPHQVHELRTGESACLMAYGWTGELVGENWWWEEQSDGSWERVCWRRMPDSSWQIAEREPLGDREIRRAGDR
jgi:hypothetical protein